MEFPAGTSAPEWVEMIPAGPQVLGRAGRKGLNDRPQGVVDEFKARNTPLPFDWEHATEHKAPLGEPAPAAGWIEELEARDGAVWGRVAWTPKGAEMVANKEYRFHSPVFVYEKTSLRIIALASAGLTNTPNLHLTALNREEKKSMNEKLLASLGLAAGATEDQAVSAALKLRSDLDLAKNREETLKDDLAKAKNKADAPDLSKFVPRADYDATCARAANAEQKLADHLKQSQEAEIETAVGDAVKAGKITPATADYHKAQCRTEGGLERFREFVKAAPVVGDPSGAGGKPPENPGGALSEAQRAVCKAMGMDEEEYKKAMA